MSGFQYVELPAREVLFNEHEPGDCAYVVERGALEISVKRNGERVVLTHIGPGEIVGELAILSDERRAATAVALEETVVRKIHADQFARRVLDMDPVMRLLIETVMKRLHRTVRLLKNDGQPAPELFDARSPFVDEALESLRLENDIALALKRGEMRAFYQPIVDLRSGKLRAFEALVRWMHPTRGLLAPDQFIPTANESSLIRQITSFCITRAAADLPRMRVACLSNPANVEPVNVNVNVTGRDLESGNIVDQLNAALAANGLVGRDLSFEITESSLMVDTTMAARVLDDIRALGTGVAIDDFGTGFSNMAYLAGLPATTIKIDRSFVSRCFADDEHRKIVVTILRLAQQLGMSTVAEGIETPQEFSLLCDEGAEYGQGFLFAKPMPLDEALGLIAGWDAARAAIGGAPINVEGA
ncbi:MAG: EAL domain-containing protein [Pseudomonadota bacterium]